MVVADKRLYCFTYIDDNCNENLIEVYAYSEEQANIILGMDSDRIIDIECTVRKSAVG